MANKTSDSPAMFDDIMAAQQTFIDKYKKPILILVAAALAITAIVLGWIYLRDKNQREASEAMFTAQEYFMMGEFDKALNGDPEGSKGFLAVADEWSSSKAGNLARGYAGLCYAHLGQWEEAKAELENFDTQDDCTVSPAMVAALGNAYANLDEPEKAAKKLAEAAEMASGSVQSPIYLQQAGELYESLGQKDKALECYKELKQKYPQSPLRYSIDKYIERASK